MLLVALMMMADRVGDMLAHYRAETAIIDHCVPGATGSAEVTVCARRAASRFRIPDLGPEPGSRAEQNVPDERARLIGRTTPCHQQQGQLVGCGSTGVGVSVPFGGGRKGAVRFVPPPGGD